MHGTDAATPMENELLERETKDYTEILERCLHPADTTVIHEFYCSFAARVARLYYFTSNTDVHESPLRDFHEIVAKLIDVERFSQLRFTNAFNN